MLISFMSGINFSRKLFSHFSQLALLLHQLDNQANFMWNTEAQHHFEKLNTSLCSTPSLHLPDLEQAFKIESYASQFAIGAILKHRGHPVAYHLETLSKDKLNYITYEKEFYIWL
jgi:hypothetical protein